MADISYPHTRRERPLPAWNTWLRLSVGLLYLALVSALYILVCILLLPSRVLRIYAGNLYGKLVGSVVSRLMGFRTVVHHAERLDPKRPAIYLANHASTLDMWIGMWQCPLGGCGTAKKEIVRVPFFGQAYWLSGHMLLDRGNRERAIATMQAVTEVVNGNKLSLWVWPEGTRSPDGRLQPLKKGFAHLALATKLPIVCLVQHNAHRLWPGRTFDIYPGELHIDVLEPIETSHWSSDTIDEHVAQVHSAFAAALGPDQQPQEAD